MSNKHSQTVTNAERKIEKLVESIGNLANGPTTGTAAADRAALKIEQQIARQYNRINNANKPRRRRNR